VPAQEKKRPGGWVVNAELRCQGQER
jgi:hypothetical protein